jgi:hypothetical protein
VGGHPYHYFVPDETDAGSALHRLRAREFEAGRYNPVQPFVEFPLNPRSPVPGNMHSTIDEAREAAAEEGTRSILDIDRLSEVPACGCAGPFNNDFLLDIFRTTEPEEASVRARVIELLAPIERGECLYLHTSVKGARNGVFFAGYSYD